MTVMKRYLTLTLVLCLMLSLCACGGEASPTETTTEATTETTTEATAETTTEATTEAPVLYRHPLTGEPLDAPFTTRPVTVSIGNTKSALPQMGISHADVLYQIEAEGGITRFLPIFTDVAGIERIGPVRSARTFFNNVTASYDAVIAHCGGSVRGIKGYHDLTGSKIPSWDHIDQFANGKYFYRDADRKADGYALEHRLCITGDKLLEALEAKDYLTNEVIDYGYQFAEDDELVLSGETASEVTVTFLGDQTSTFTYDPETATYSMRQYDRDLIDGNTNEQLFFKNLLVLYTSQKKEHDGFYNRSYYDLIGEGEGYFAVNGQIVEITWTREELKEPFVYTLADGTPITLGVGKTYVGIASTKSEDIKYE